MCSLTTLFMSILYFGVLCLSIWAGVNTEINFNDEEFEQMKKDANLKMAFDRTYQTYPREDL